MAYEIIWLPRAEQRFDEIISYLEAHWSEKEIRQFVQRTNDVVSNIAINPKLYRHSAKRNIYEAIITKHNILLFKIGRRKVELLTFFDTRQHPGKNTGSKLI